MDRPLIETVDLARDYDGRTVVDVDHLGIAEGDVLGLLGRNGSGKSTLLRLLCLLEEPSRGDVLFAGRRLDTEAERLSQRRKMAMVFQEPLLFSGTVRFNISYGLSVRGAGAAEVRSRCERTLEILGITHLAGRNVDTLSGGEAQRVSLARALVTGPEVLFLDEPMANLDAPTRQSFKRDLARVLSDLGVTAVYVTHDISEALYLCNRVAVMSSGRIVQDSTPTEVWNRPATAEAASLVGIETLIPGFVIGRNGSGSLVSVSETANRATLISDRPAPEGARVCVCIRPENVVCSREPVEGAANRFSAGITDIEPLATGARLTLDCGFILVAHVGPRAVQSLALHRGGRVHVGFSASDAHLIV